MVFINISVYKDSKKVMDKDIKISAKNKEHLLMTTFTVATISPGILKLFLGLVATYPALIKDLPFVLKLSAENALEYIGYLEYLITNGLL